MPRQKRARRFEPRYGVSQSTLDLEAKYLGRGVEDDALWAPAEVAGKVTDRHADCRNIWEHLRLLLETMPERDRQILQALVFRDLWLVFELYRTYLAPHAKASVAKTARNSGTPEPLQFSQFLFDL